ncbi:organelle RRM domain-containing protein 2, mitochondrial-like isoform X2 [Typha angustifolia]|uniref:organelle RRM domain-containing protein 2, mitochondrial-like isoform X2 n=1 Tax=Typha angustifolia TaxID=59011 RepID=UPI003C2B398C
MAAAKAGFRRLFSISAFTSPNIGVFPPKAEPSTNLFVSGLSKRTTTEGLRDAFAKFGQVVYARVVTDRLSGYSKGFGFVKYATLEDAAQGIEGMDGKFLDGWVIFAEYARPRAPLQPEPPSPSTQSWESPLSSKCDRGQIVRNKGSSILRNGVGR